MQFEVWIFKETGLFYLLTGPDKSFDAYSTLKYPSAGSSQASLYNQPCYTNYRERIRRRWRVIPAKFSILLFFFSNANMKIVHSSLAPGKRWNFFISRSAINSSFRIRIARQFPFERMNDRLLPWLTMREEGYSASEIFVSRSTEKFTRFSNPLPLQVISSSSKRNLTFWT